MGKPGVGGLRRILDASRYSAQGLAYAWRMEAAFRQEAVLAAVLVPAAFWIGRDAIEIAALIACCLLVLIVELINSAIEATVDRFGDEHHVLAGGAKDMGSAAVLASLLLLVCVWGAIIYSRFAA